MCMCSYRKICCACGDRPMVHLCVGIHKCLKSQDCVPSEGFGSVLVDTHLSGCFSVCVTCGYVKLAFVLLTQNAQRCL